VIIISHRRGKKYNFLDQNNDKKYLGLIQHARKMVFFFLNFYGIPPTANEKIATLHPF